MTKRKNIPRWTKPKTEFDPAAPTCMECKRPLTEKTWLFDIPYDGESGVPKGVVHSHQCGHCGAMNSYYVPDVPTPNDPYVYTKLDS